MRRGFAHTKIDGKADMMVSSKMTEKHLVMLSRQLELTGNLPIEAGRNIAQVKGGLGLGLG